MCKFSKMEIAVLELAQTAADDKIVAANLSKNGKTVTPPEIRTYKSRARRKVAKAQKFLQESKKYNSILFPKKKYKGI